MKKYLLGLLAAPRLLVSKLSLAILLALASITSFAFTGEECAAAAESVYSAQIMLNEDAARFAAVHEKVKQTPAEEFGLSEELKEYITTIVDMLKPGLDPARVGQAVFNGCKSMKDA